MSIGYKWTITKLFWATAAVLLLVYNMVAGDGTPTNVQPVKAFTCAPYTLTTTIANSESFPVGLQSVSFKIEQRIGFTWSTVATIPGTLGTVPPNGTLDVSSTSQFTFNNSGTYRVTVSFVSPDDIDPSNNSNEIIVKVCKGNSCLLTNSNFPNAGQTADPNNAYTGGHHHKPGPDIVLGGPMPVFFARNYDVNYVNDGLPVRSLGPNWSHNFDYSLHQYEGGFIEVICGNGMYMAFEEIAAGSWSRLAPADVPYQLIEDGSDFLLSDPIASIVYVFNTVGLLTQIDDTHGNTLDLLYNPSNQLATVTDGLGRQLNFSYDLNGNLEQVANGAQAVQFTYNNGVLTEYVNNDGQTTVYMYAPVSAGTAVLNSIEYPNGNTPYTNATQANQYTEQTNALGGTTTITYPPQLGGTTTITNPDATSYELEHNNTGGLIRLGDEAGNDVTYEYDSFGRRIRMIDREGNTTNYTYDAASGKIASTTTPEGDVTTYTYGDRTHRGLTLRQLIGIVHPDGSSSTFTYDANGNLTQRTTQENEQYTYTYNANGQVLSTTLPTGGSVHRSYNADGTIASSMDEEGNVTTYEYDSEFRLIKTNHPNGGSTQYTYDDMNRVLTQTDPEGNTVSFAYDANGNRISSTDENGNTTQYTYDAMDRLIQVVDPENNNYGIQRDNRARVTQFTDPNGNSLNVEYDQLGRPYRAIFPGTRAYERSFDSEFRPLETTHPGGQTYSYTYDRDGFRTGITTPNATSSTWQYDASGNLVQAIDPLGRQSTYTYDGQNRLRGANLPGGRSVGINYNTDGQPHEYIDPLGSTWSTGWTDRQQAESFTDPLGNTTEYQYDASGRRIGSTYPGGLGSSSYTYDQNGRLTQRSYSDGTNHSYTYDPAGRVIATTNAGFTHGAVYPFTESNGIQNVYDPAGRIVQVIYEQGKEVDYTYDPAGRCKEIIDWNGKTTTCSYDANNNLTEIQYPNGVTTTNQFDPAGRVLSIIHGNHASITIDYNDDGTIASSTRDVPLQPTAPGMDHTFSYDAASQESSNTYDARGNLLDDGDRQFEWNLAGELKKVTTGGIESTFDYDGFGNVVQWNKGTDFWDFYINYAFPNLPIQIETKNGSETRQNIFHPDGFPICQIDPANNTFFFHFDENGNMIFTTNENGDLAGKAAYSPTGETIEEENLVDFFMRGCAAKAGRNFPPTGLCNTPFGWQDTRTGRAIRRDEVQPLNPSENGPYTLNGSNPVQREWQGLELVFRKRFSNNWQLLASYNLTASTLENENINRRANELDELADEGFRLGGPIVKDKAWYFTPQSERNTPTTAARNTNQLWGDYNYVDPANSFAQGEPLVHIEADPGAPGLGANDYTFYGRYTSDPSGPWKPIGYNFASRYLNDSYMPRTFSDASAGGARLSPSVTVAPARPVRNPCIGGTSMGSPHAAGALALLQGQNPGCNLDVLIKMLENAPQHTDHFWVFAAGLTNVEYSLRVEDAQANGPGTYVNPLNSPFQPIQDTNAFATCP